MKNLSTQNVSTKTIFINQKSGKNMTFLPPEYKSPSNNTRYMKLQEGENKFRILTQPILGWEDWNDKSPIRYRFDQKPEHSIDPLKPAKHFWAFAVFNYSTETVQILFLTQASVRNAIEALSRDEEWGAPYYYDIKVTKTGKDKLTKYSVSPSPHKELSPYIVECFNECPCWLDVLYSNGDPFSPGYREYTPLAISSDDSPQINKGEYIDELQKQEIKGLVFQDENPDDATKKLFLRAGCSSFDEIKKDKYQSALKWVLSRLEAQGKDQAVPF